MTSPGLDELAAIFPAHPRSKLRKLLDASRGSVERATLALLDKGGIEDAVVSSKSEGTKRKRPRLEDGGGGKAGKLGSWLSQSPFQPKPLSRDSKPTLEPLEISDSDDDTSRSGPTPLPSAFAKLRAPPSPAQTPTSQPPALPPLTLATPALVGKHTAGLCELIPDFLPRDLAGRLFARMIKESRGEGECPACEWRLEMAGGDGGCEGTSG